MHKQIHSFHQVSSLFHHPTTMAAVCMIAWCAVFAALASAAEVPSIPTDFHAVVSTTSDGIFCQYPNFHEVYQDLTNNRALLVMEKSTVLLIVAPKGAAPGTKEETDMTSFTVNNDGSCSYEVNDWPCVVPRLYISQCSTIFGYPVFNKVGPWQIPNSVPGNYSGQGGDYNQRTKHNCWKMDDWFTTCWYCQSTGWTPVTQIYYDSFTRIHNHPVHFQAVTGPTRLTMSNLSAEHFLIVWRAGRCTSSGTARAYRKHPNHLSLVYWVVV